MSSETDAGERSTLRESILQILSVGTLTASRFLDIVALISDSYRWGFFSRDKVDGEYVYFKFFNPAKHRRALDHYIREINNINTQELADTQKVHGMIVHTLGFFAYLIEEQSQELTEKFYPLIRYIETGSTDDLQPSVKKHYRYHCLDVSQRNTFYYYGQVYTRKIYFPVLPERYINFADEQPITVTIPWQDCNDPIVQQLAAIRDKYLPLSPRNRRKALIGKEERVTKTSGWEKIYFPACPGEKDRELFAARVYHEPSVYAGIIHYTQRRLPQVAQDYLPYQAPPEQELRPEPTGISMAPLD